MSIYGDKPTPPRSLYQGRAKTEQEIWNKDYTATHPDGVGLTPAQQIKTILATDTTVTPTTNIMWPDGDEVDNHDRAMQRSEEMP